MMHLFFGWLLGAERVGRPVVNDAGEQLGTIALHWGNNKAEQLGTIALRWRNDEAGAIGDNCSTLGKQQSRAIGDNCSTLGSTLGLFRWPLKHARRRSQRCCRRQGRSDARW